ncbi:hypothetical protein OPV22_006663 [Ensete ventricosum]|uniref:Uncharacterized protein n=1 Tax=Ensete ventricosum TaxID=4639 RepID=A0AAV8QC81_ENSVE|nr:hypothetical protein OPV22_006663 [Ensete ventricosum]
MEEMQSFNKETVLRDLRDESEEPGEESYNDSNSKSEGYDTTTTSDLDDEAEKISSIKQQEVQQLDESRYKVTEEVAHEFESYGDYTISALGKNSLEQLDTQIEDLVLYANDMAPLALLPSSICGAMVKMVHWVQGDQPFIGKESEQYFSMLMLQEDLMVWAKSAKCSTLLLWKGMNKEASRRKLWPVSCTERSD